MFQTIVSKFFVDVVSAADEGHTVILRYLLQQPGVNVNQYRYSMSALHLALLHDRFPCALLLLEAGADPDKGIFYEEQNRWKSSLITYAQGGTD